MGGNEMRGNCYVAAEALYHILGGPDSDWEPAYLKTKTDTHWFLRKRYNWNEVLDPSRLQFKGKLPNYYKAKGCGFLTKQPSKRAQKLIQQLTWQESE